MSARPNQFWLDLRSEEGRAQISVDLSALSKPERAFLFELLKSAHEGKRISFDIGEAVGGSEVMSFTFTDGLLVPAAPGEGPIGD
jgi:hypothetical protein